MTSPADSPRTHASPSPPEERRTDLAQRPIPELPCDRVFEGEVAATSGGDRLSTRHGLTRPEPPAPPARPRDAVRTPGIGHWPRRRTSLGTASMRCCRTRLNAAARLRGRQPDAWAHLENILLAEGREEARSRHCVLRKPSSRSVGFSGLRAMRADHRAGWHGDTSRRDLQRLVDWPPGGTVSAGMAGDGRPRAIHAALSYDAKKPVGRPSWSHCAVDRQPGG